MYKAEFTVKIKPLTPIWTGDENRKNTTLRETGIIGSLRWWYEALVRGLGGSACDPTNTRCDGKNHCDACELFGCTGWTRKFILRIDTLKENYAPFVIAKPPDSNKPYFLGYYDNTGDDYMKNGGLLGEHKLTFIAEQDKLHLIKLLSILATKWGLGAGVQKGFGIAHIEDNIQFSNVKILSGRNKTLSEYHNMPLPRIDQFFFYRIPVTEESIPKIREVVGHDVYKTMKDLRTNQPLNNIFSTSFYIPTAPWVRKSIRRLFEDTILRHFMMGFVGVSGELSPIHLNCWKHSIVKDRNNEYRYYCTECKRGNIEDKDILEKTGSKIFVSHIYNKNASIEGKEPAWEMKIWGWIPDLPKEIGSERKDVKELLQSNIKSEDFWKNTFGIDNNPVNVENIWKNWDIKPHDLLESGGELYE